MSSTRMMQIWLGASMGGARVVRTRADALLARGARASSSASAPEASLKYTHSWAIRVATDASSSGGLSITAGWLPRLPSRRTRSAEAAVVRVLAGVHALREIEVLQLLRVRRLPLVLRRERVLRLRARSRRRRAGLRRRAGRLRRLRRRGQRRQGAASGLFFFICVRICPGYPPKCVVGRGRGQCVCSAVLCIWPSSFWPSWPAVQWAA